MELLKTYILETYMIYCQSQKTQKLENMTFIFYILV